jgi:hypothetical protein
VPESVHVVLNVRGQADRVQAACVLGLQQHARDLGFRLAEQRSTSLVYRPRLHFPLLITLVPWLVRRARGEHLTIEFAPADQVTQVTITGRASPRATDREQWSEALGRTIG